MEHYDKIILGAGLYGLYAALFCARRGQRVLVAECDPSPFGRATYINQARVHQGYHYPRSISTAIKSAGYFERFCRDYAFCINREFDQVYATSSQYSWTDNSLRISVKRQVSPVKKSQLTNILKNTCVTVHFLHGNIPMMLYC